MLVSGRDVEAAKMFATLYSFGEQINYSQISMNNFVKETEEQRQFSFEEVVQLLTQNRAFVALQVFLKLELKYMKDYVVNQSQDKQKTFAKVYHILI